MTTSNEYTGQLNGRQGRPFRRWKRIGFAVIECLPNLKGKPWNELTIGYIHALRPTHVRVVKHDDAQLDSELWRVTVWLREDGKTIDRIEQEVEVGLPKDCPNGAELDAALKSTNGEMFRFATTDEVIRLKK